ncbi:SGNH/GDSL hydrolase family protein [Rhizobium ruizarguesonis]
MLLVFLLMAAPISAFAQAGPSDEMFATVSAKRDDYGPVIFTFGDSVMRGYALGFFPDSSTKEQMDNPNWELRSPASQLRSRGFMAVYAGLNGQPDLVEDGAERIADLVKRGIIRDGDVIVLEDAGRHDKAPMAYFDNWLKIGAALRGVDVKLIMMTIPDGIKSATVGADQADLYRYSIEFGGISFNDATTFAAHVLGAKLIDFKTMINAVTKSGYTVLHDDGIHPNIKGQTILVDAIIRECTSAYIGKHASR